MKTDQSPAPVRRVSRLPLVLIALGAAALGGGFAMHGQKRSQAAPVAAVAERFVSRAQAALDSRGKSLEVPAAEAARLPPLLAAVRDEVDAATFQDAFENEDWWNPFRSRGRVSALVVSGKPLASLFLESPMPVADDLIKRASANKVASGLIKGSGRVYAAAAARLEPAGGQHEGVIILAEVLTQEALTAAALTSGAALGISDGQQLLLAGGPAAQTAALPQLLGQEGAPAGATADYLPFASKQLPGGLWLWAVGAVPLAAPSAVNPLAFVFWGLGAVFVLAGVVVLFRTPTQPLTPAEAPAAALPAKATVIGTGPTAPRVAETHGTSDPRTRKPSGEISVSETMSATAVAVDLREQKPHVLGRYSLLDRIGEGGMAEIFRAILHGAEGFERTLVVKRMHPHLLGLPEAVAQFVDEARLQSGLAHSNIVSVFDFGRAGNDYFLALEYVAGKDLEKVLLRHMSVHGKPLPTPIAMTIIREVLLALEYAHTRVDAKGKPMEIVHRDVSLSNVLVSYAGEVKLSDFGIVKAESRVSKTQMGMVKGNAGYMSPEQARGEAVDARADVFAAGVVAFCCLVGHALYNSKELTPINQILRAAVGPGHTEFSRMDLEMTKLDPELVQVIKQAMAPTVDQRIRSAGEFARMLRPFATASREDISQLMHELFAAEISRDA
ncbi:MAG: serine/threonine-protein kinase [Deltaproteobacteria bacterium]|nr:serine/threonine-protein kinase [Deltaproteobacteria bacterium]